MSESENLNFDADLPNRPVDVERILSELEPQPLSINRDELLFQAGIAAGSRRRTAGLFWPSAVAALLLISCGLGTALVWQVVSIDSLKAALAVTEQSVTQNISQSNSHARSQLDVEHDFSDRLSIELQQRRWLGLASTASLPPGRLTAMGWQELPAEMRNEYWGIGNRLQRQQSDSSVEPEAAPHRPATYLELMRMQREG
jgi:hypothetical protein